MQAERFEIKYISVHNCFLYLPEYWLRKVSSKSNIVKLTHKGKDYYLSWFLLPSPNAFPSLSATFARSLDIKEGDEVLISCMSEPPSLTSITVIPKNKQDLEILEIQCAKVQATLLNQISIVAKNQPIVAWVSKQLYVTMVVDSLDPNFCYGKLYEHSEVHVKDATAKRDTKHTPESEDTQDHNTGRGIWSIFKYLPSMFADSSQEITTTDIQSELDKYINKSPPQVFRVHEILRIEDATQTNSAEISFRCPYNVFIHKSHLPNFFDFAQENLCKIRKVRENRQYINTNTHLLKENDLTVPKETTEFIVKLLCLEDHLEQCSNSINKGYFATNSMNKCIFLSANLKRNLKIKVGGKIVLEPYEAIETNISSVELFSSDESLTSEVFENYVKQRSKYERVLINSCSRIVFDNGKNCMIRFSPDCKYVYFNTDCLRNLKLYVHNVIGNDDEDSEYVDKVQFSVQNISMRIFEHIISECKVTLSLSLGLHNIKDLNYDRENILICGDLGTGKTTICKILIHELRKPPNFIYTHMIECKPLKGKKAEVIQKVLQSAMADCVFHQYSVLILDDLECITNASTNDEETTPDSMNAARITDMIVKVLIQYQAAHYITLVATCSNLNKIGQKLRTPRGLHFFRTILSIPALEKEDRIEILQLNLKDKLELSDEIDWDYYGNKTEGWVVQDMVDMVEKVAFTAWKRHVNNKSKSTLMVLEEDLSSTLDRCKPMSLQGIHLYKGPGHLWSDIGGLAEVKTSLIEILHWPLKYPHIFKNAPIKLQSGVLLYGMPGTGKTMLAGAIAKECGLNMISVKGPELLSKYIGASEESVRNIFEKAQRAKPCVLFFDEFDSLAPRRGHDSTGVTDRVVNQLLTQLDGVEGREGIAIVAATSRPDLLDPALLRPGRLDKLLLCPLPDEIEREEILKAVCKSHRINTENLDLKELATLSTGFTGADLNAVLTQARLAALEEALETASPEEKKTIDGRKLSQKHLLDSLRSTNPSLTSAEKNKYNFVYSRFSTGGDFSGEILKNQKATLA